ncbi:hypothetical protein [Rubinisphaera italica]|uniref:DUF4149 domain-containing protein n=1 Tax=Rubinisphaera italica TaxID=2527969 RepID=A0A5C5XA89_9PLAN|nr:hypothetical protein [Rubinisphaera italica]TWT59890.1 hypothetical protein Pan54_06010 [Rubinisphaera italica]
MLSKFFLLILRFCISGWVGAAILFVILTVQEIRLGQFESILLDRLILIRFPIYYTFSFVMIGLASLTGSLYWILFPALRSTKIGVSLILLTLLIMVGDYLFVYSELAAMLLPVGSPRPHNFHGYHVLTERLNALAVLMGIAGAILVNWGEASRKGEPSQS